VTANEIKQAVLEAINDHPAFDPEIHSAHHAWIEERIESERARKEVMQEAAKAFAQWSVVGIAGAVWYYFKGHWTW